MAVREGYAPPSQAEEAHRVIDSLFATVPYLPPVNRAYVAEDGTIWLRTTVGEGHRDRWVLIGADGAPLGYVDLPESSVVEWGTARHVWLEEHDAFDVPWLVRYRVEIP
jgi:hypothetical protein